MSSSKPDKEGGETRKPALSIVDLIIQEQMEKNALVLAPKPPEVEAPVEDVQPEPIVEAEPEPETAPEEPQPVAEAETEPEPEAAPEEPQPEHQAAPEPEAPPEEPQPEPVAEAAPESPSEQPDSAPQPALEPEPAPESAILTEVMTLEEPVETDQLEGPAHLAGEPDDTDFTDAIFTPPPILTSTEPIEVEDPTPPAAEPAELPSEPGSLSPETPPPSPQETAAPLPEATIPPAQAISNEPPTQASHLEFGPLQSPPPITVTQPPDRETARLVGGNLRVLEQALSQAPKPDRPRREQAAESISGPRPEEKPPFDPRIGLLVAAACLVLMWPALTNPPKKATPVPTPRVAATRVVSDPQVVALGFLRALENRNARSAFNYLSKRQQSTVAPEKFEEEIKKFSRAKDNAWILAGVSLVNDPGSGPHRSYGVRRADGIPTKWKLHLEQDGDAWYVSKVQGMKGLSI